jgi:DNA-binding protein YbaB
MAGKNDDVELARLFGDLGVGMFDRQEAIEELIEEIPTRRTAARSGNMVNVPANTSLVPPPSLRRSPRVMRELEKKALTEAVAAAAKAAAAAEKKLAKNAKEERRADLKFLTARVTELHGDESPEDLRARAANPLLEGDIRAAILKLAQMKESTQVKKLKVRDEYRAYLLNHAERARKLGEIGAESMLRAQANAVKGGKRKTRKSRK